MQILVTGSSGLIGSALVASLTRQGHPVRRLVRRPPEAGDSPQRGHSALQGVPLGTVPDLQWNPESRLIDPTRLEGIEAVVHLAGDPIVKGRWTPEKKRRIRDSRVQGTQLLSESLAKLQRPPRVMVCASAVGVYGNRGDEILREDSPPGIGFLAEVGQAWEQAAHPARAKGIRVVHLRFGIILSPAGGALKMMLPPFRIGIGGRLGSGKQWMNWLTLEEAVAIIQYALATESIRGPINAVSPNPVTNSEFTKVLGKALRRPTLFPVPAFVLRIIFGEMAEEALLSSTRAVPARLTAAGYRFRHPDLQEALNHLLNPSPV